MTKEDHRLTSFLYLHFLPSSTGLQSCHVESYWKQCNICMAMVLVLNCLCWVTWFALQVETILLLCRRVVKNFFWYPPLRPFRDYCAWVWSCFKPWQFFIVGALAGIKVITMIVSTLIQQAEKEAIRLGWLSYNGLHDNLQYVSTNIH